MRDIIHRRRVVLPRAAHDNVAFVVLVLAIAAANWVQYARTVRGTTMVERHKEYVQAARVVGRSPLAIMRLHLLPNVLGTVLVAATSVLGQAILLDATIEFFNYGLPASRWRRSI